MDPITGDALDALRAKLERLDQPPADHHRLVIVVDLRGVPASEQATHDVAFACLTDDDEVLRDLVVGDHDQIARRGVASAFVAAEWLP